MRALDEVHEELNEFFAVLAELGTVPAGVHLELTGSDVNECVSSRRSLSTTTTTAAIALANTTANTTSVGVVCGKYLTECDPRLNAQQSMATAAVIASHLTQTQTPQQR